MSSFIGRSAVVFVLVLLIISPRTALASSITVFSTGYVVPETIALIPPSWGGLSGQYLVTDASQNAIFLQPSAGGPPSIFASTPGILPSGGVFLPSTYGTLGGDFLVGGFNGTPAQRSAGDLVALNSQGVESPVFSHTSADDFWDTFVIAPSTFGSVGGEALLANQNGNVYALQTNGTLSTFAATSLIPAGLAFAPSGCGSIAGDLLVTDAASGAIDVVDPSGSVRHFATLPLFPGQTGLRQIAFAPAGFGPYGGDLFVSVSGSAAGGGTFGSVDVLKCSGAPSALVAILEQGTVGLPFDPRGLYFADSSSLLIADADPGILEAPPSAFTPVVPEPATLTLTALGLAGVVSRCRRRRASR
jgi:hypothetical protein